MTPVVVTEKDNNGSIRLLCDQQLTVRLRENASTGFRWMPGAVDEAALSLKSDVFVLDTLGGIGRGGQRTFTFLAVKPAEVRLHFELRRSWDPSNTTPAGSFTLAVSIGPSVS